MQKQPFAFDLQNRCLQNFAKFTEKHLCWRVLFNKFPGGACNFIQKDTPTQLFSLEFCEISKKNFYFKSPPVAASAVKSRQFKDVFCKKAILNNFAKFYDENCSGV